MPDASPSPVHLPGRSDVDPLRYFRQIAKVVSVPWDLTIGADLANPGVIGKRIPPVRMINVYIPRLHAAAAADPALAVAFTRVSGLAAPPQSLLRPDRFVRVITGNRRRRGQDGSAVPRARAGTT